MNGQSLASINTQLKKLASDRAHPIILDRISPAELKNMLRNEMSFSLKSFMNFAKSENQNNSQLILHVKQFEALLFQYRNHIGQSDILDCYLEMGQHLINMENCHQVAHFMCFAQALSIMGKMEEGKTRRYHIAVFGSLISNYIQITKFDPNFQMESSISKLDGIMRAFREILAIKDIDEWTQSHAIYYLYQLSKVCMRSSLAATLLLEDHCNWFCEYITEQASPIDQRLFEVISANTHLLHNKKTLESMIKSEIDEQPDTNSATKCRVTLINALFLLQIEKIAGETDEALLTRPNGPTQFSHGIPPVSAELQQFKAYARDIHTETNEDLDLNNLLPFSCMSNFSTLPLKAYDFYPDNIAKYEPSCFKKLEKYLISAKLVLGDKSDNNVQRNQALLLSQIANGADWQFFNENLHARANTKRSDDLLDFKSKRQVLVDLHFLVINYKALSCRLDAILNTLKKRMHHYKSLAIWPKITETECRADFVYFRLLDMAYLMVAQNDPYTLEMLISMFESQNYLRGGLSNPDAPDSSKDIPAGTFLPSQLVTLAMILFHVGQFERCNNIIRLMPHISDSTLQREYALFVSFVTMFYSQQLFKLSGNQNMDNILASIANLSFFIDKSLHLNPRCQLIGDSCLLLSNVSAAPEPALELRYELLSFLVSASMVIEDRADITLCNQCQKLASKYQQKHEFQKARYLWSAGIKLVKHQRYIEGGCAELPWAVTSDTAFHSADNSVKTHRQSLNNLESIELDLLYAFYRCEIFEQEVLSMEHVAKKEIELLRLSQMKRKLPLKSIIPDDHAIEVAVGHSAVRSCLYLLAVCMECQNHNQSEKLQLIQKAYKLIQKACNLESNLVNLQGIDTSQCDIRIVRRTGTSMAIAVNSSKSGWIRIVCKLSGDISGKASSHVLGTNVWYPICGGVEIELNMWQLALEDAMTISAEFSETRGSRTGLIRSNILIADNNPPLPLAAIWGYLSQIAHQNNFHEIADTAFDRGVLYLVAHQAKDLFSTVPIPVGPGSESYFFKLSPFIAHIPLVNLKASVQSIFAKIAREEAVSSQVHIDKHHFSLSLALKLMIAISLAKVCNDSSVILVCCLSLFSKIQDFLRNQHPIQFLTHALFYCFQNLITCADIDVSWDPIVKKYLLPMGQYLITRLLAIEQPFIASKVLQDASAFIGKVITNLSDNRIQSSAIIEQTWIGSARKAKLVKGTNTRNYCMEEFYHNVSVSLKTNPLLGLEDSRCVTDVFLEAMEVRIAQHAHLMPGTQTIDASVDASTLLTSRPILQPKRIVEQQSTLRDIFITFLTCGADWTLQELGKFRKNPRYFELVIKLGQWCLERDQNESAIKIAMEIEEWLEKRSQTFYHFEDIILETDGQREVLVKRRRNLIFADDKAQLKDSMKGVAM